jgi:alanine racemase
MSLLEPTLQPTSVPALPEAAIVGGLLTIDLSAIEANWKRLASKTLPVECAAVVKGDGYGFAASSR